MANPCSWAAPRPARRSPCTQHTASPRKHFGGPMRGISITIGLAACLLFATAVFAQEGINGTLSGTVSDATGALIPGVEVTAKNTATGVTSTSITNETGTYRFPSLQPGSYEATAALTGFSSQTIRLSLGTSQQIRHHFALPIGN